MVHKTRRYETTQPEIERLHPPQAALEDAVADALANNASIDVTGVSVIALGQTIVLKGTVFAPEEIQRCEETARAVQGVEAVDNRLSLTPGNEATGAAAPKPPVSS
ncbi:BON domain-containing protein [Allorhizobium sp. BGMRC 0089]|uniref:BON domain-containing protein n=1 Tax=Allorhizobium sonneratiae TaxID=2934936 RepID=UPI002033FED4|nr:BON domain-containing protein [Allorhizobium sonneratiae]MCM2294061.1 BON domain-containing protein [Allorhizobium sonneratiae]